MKAILQQPACLGRVPAHNCRHRQQRCQASKASKAYHLNLPMIHTVGGSPTIRNSTWPRGISCGMQLLVGREFAWSAALVRGTSTAAAETLPPLSESSGADPYSPDGEVMSALNAPWRRA